MTLRERRRFLKQTFGSAAAFALAPELSALPFRAVEPLSVALVGYGRQGRKVLSELHKFEQVSVAAVCDVQSSRLASAARREPEAAGYESVAELIDGSPDVRTAVVATPTHTHRPVAEELVAAGFDVYCEAPLAHSVEDALAIAHAARASGQVLQVGMTGRTNPIYGLARKFWRSGSIRDVVTVRAHANEKTSWRVPTREGEDDLARNWRLDPAVSLGLVGERGVHQLDVVDWFMNEAPVGVSGFGSLRMHDDGREMPDTESCSFRFSSGLELRWEGTLANSFEKSNIALCGTMGTFKLAEDAGWMFKEADAATQGWEVYANREQFHDEQGITLIADATKLAAQDRLKDGVGLPNPPLYYALEAFAKSVTEGAPIATTAADGVRMAAIAIAARRAIDTGEFVKISPELWEDA